MVVVNIVGFPYKVKLTDGRIVILPNDNRPHQVPDELLDLFKGKKYDNVFRVLVPPRPKLINTDLIPTTVITEVKPEIVEISLEDDEFVEEKPVEKKVEVKKKPLKGRKIKAKRRKALTKKRNKKEE